MRALSLALALFSPVVAAFGCGMTLSMPDNHFDGVNEYGAASIWDQIGGIKLPGGESLPLYINFRSDRQTSSSVLGQGWMFSLLEANIAQVDERTFIMTDPTGRFRYLRRDKTDVNLIESKSWRGEIKDNQIMVWADCGWKLVFTQGKITSITTPKNETLEIVYLDGTPREVRCNGVTLLQVNRDTTGLVTGITTGALQTHFQFDRRPVIQTVGKVNLVASTVPTLVKVSIPKVIEKSYEFGLSDKLEPTLKTASNFVTWDPATNKILKDGDWSYTIDFTSKAKIPTATITRKGLHGELESFADDTKTGITTVIDKTGLKTVTERFTGKDALSGKIRKTTKTLAGAVIYTYKAIYDEMGRKIRETSDSKAGGIVETVFSFDDKGRPTAAMRNGQELWKKVYDAEGRLVEETAETGRKTLWSYLPDGKMMKTIVDAAGKKAPAICQPNGKPLPVDMYYDALGRTSLRRDEKGDTWEYSTRTSPLGFSYTLTSINGLPQIYSYKDPVTDKMVTIRFATLSGVRFPYGSVGGKHLPRFEAVKLLKKLLEGVTS